MSIYKVEFLNPTKEYTDSSDCEAWLCYQCIEAYQEDGESLEKGREIHERRDSCGRDDEDFQVEQEAEIRLRTRGF